MLKTIFREFKSSIKSPDTEEKLDLILYRPSGFVIAKISHSLWLTPSMLSLMGLLSGLVAGYYFLDPVDKTNLVTGSLLFVLSGIFDSADGQLARISNQSSKLGLILDGICDSLVTIAIYFACAWPFIQEYGIRFGILVCLALYLHSFQCAILDFYHREYLYFGYGKTENDTYWNPSIRDAKKLIEQSSTTLERIMNSLRLTWVKKQHFLTSRSDDDRKWLKTLYQEKSFDERQTFMALYRSKNLWLLPFWRLIGVNAHTVLIIAFIFLGRFDLYLILFDLIVFNLLIFIVGYMQKKSDHLLFEQLGMMHYEG